MAAVTPVASPFAGVADAELPGALDKAIGGCIDAMMVATDVNAIPPLSQKAADIISDPIFQGKGMDAQLADIRANVGLHGNLQAILLKIQATEWGADGAALAALSREAAALITDEIEANPSLAGTVGRIRTDVGNAINAKKPAA